MTETSVHSRSERMTSAPSRSGRPRGLERGGSRGCRVEVDPHCTEDLGLVVEDYGGADGFHQFNA